MEPMDVVKQTGKTIIFEEFNKDEAIMDLVTLLTRDDEEISLEKFKEALMGADSELVVESFAEFVERFSPTIYETVVKTEDGSARFVYDLEKPNYDCTEIKLKDHAFYKMIMALLDRKATSDKGNLEFPYDDLKKALSLESEREEWKKIRKNLISNLKEYTRLTTSDEPSSEADRFATNIINLRDRIIDKYKDKSPLGYLPILIADKQSQIDMIKTVEDSQGGEEGYKPIPCIPTIDNSGNLVLIEQLESDDVVVEEEIKEENIMQLVKAIRDDFDDYAPVTIRDNDYVKNMITNTVVPMGSAILSTQDRDKLEAEKKQLQDIYKSSLESFAKAVAAVVEKFAGVKSFFDHAAPDGRLPRDVSVIIANCKVDSILNDELAKKRFKKYFSALSREKDVNKIWFGIIPAISSGNAGQSTVRKTANPFGKRSADSSAVKKDATGLVGLETVKEMLSILTEVKIMTFVNYKADEKTGFIELTDTRVNQYKKDFESVNSEYAVFVYPNFTILPKEKNAVKIGTEYHQDENREVGAFITIPGIYLDASYVACGMMVGVQNYNLLKAKGFKVKPKYPCVRFDLEDAENSKRVTTCLNRETTTEMQKQVKDAIMEDRFGFVFADNKIIFDGHVLNNSYVINARSLKRDENGKYKSLYKTLVRSLVDQLLRASAENVTDQTVSQFLLDYVDSWKRDNKDEDRKYANRILLEGETIELDPGKHRLLVTYNKEHEVWDDIVINDSESEE